jgi:hypothetical protein
MTEQRHTVRAMIVALVLCMGTVFAMTSCSSNESKAKALIEEQMKNQGVTDLKMDSFFTDPNIPGKAYTSATVTYNFASSDGKPQREFLGFILAKEGSGWRIERRTGYTTDQQQASKLMAGGK